MQPYNPQDYNYWIVCLATQTVFNQKYFQIYDNLVFSSRRAFMHSSPLFCNAALNSSASLDALEFYHPQSYLVLQVLRLLLLVVTTVDTPDKVMEVVLEEFLTFSLTH